MGNRSDRHSRPVEEQRTDESRPATDGGRRGSNRQGGQQPRGGQPQGGQGRGQPQGGQPPQGSGRGRRQPPADDSGFTRRQLLAGGGGAVAAAGVGGWFFFLRSPGGAKGVADSYVSAIADNDWSSAGELFHDDSPVSQSISNNDNIDNYESYLEDNEQLSQLEELSPSIKDHIEFSHYPDYGDSTAEDVGGFQLPGPDNAGSADEAKVIVSILEVDISTWFQSEEGETPQTDHLAGDTTTVGVNVSAVSNGGDWSIWTVGGF